MSNQAWIEAFKSPVSSWLGGIFVGIFIGAAANYFANKWTDQRKKQEKTSELLGRFEKCRKQMPELFEDMAQDISGNPIKSEFVLLDIRLCYGGFPRRPFAYFMNEDRPSDTYTDDKRKVVVHSHLLDKVKILEHNGFVVDVAETEVPYYRMTEEFVEKINAMPRPS